MKARCLLAVLFSTLVCGCGVEGDKPDDPSQVRYSQGVLRIPGVKSPDWPDAAPQIAAGARVRNVVLVSLDTLRRDYVSAYGERPDLPVTHATPNIDALAARGALFLDAMAPAPTTGPSHHAIFSGLNAPIGKKLDFEQVIGGEVAHPFETLQAAGWQTAAFTGDGQMAPIYGWTVGFDEYTSVSFGTLGVDEMEVRELAQVEKNAYSWLENHHQAPFFLFLHSYEVHCPYWPPAEYRARYLSSYEGEARRIECSDIENGSSADPILARTLYAGSVAYADAFIGRLWARLEKLGRTQDTMLILLSDHGEQLGEDNGYIGHQHMHPSVMRIPLVIYLPGSQPLAETSAVSGIDVLPTIFGALGLQPPYELMGQSLLPLIDRAEHSFPDQRLRFAHQGQDFSVFKLDNQLFVGMDPARPALIDWRTRAAQDIEKQAAIINHMRQGHQDMIDSHQDLASRFFVARTIETGSPDPAREELMKKLRSLGYIQ